ncbi:hypothetical protein BT93_L3500 [Corymbia citriodora subsp. variegata]|uniref:Uncharacterized protein n=1 Tax=Corymbia citriodora subsp. variegata TaxID=360336 RepID=A0A8T0CZE8_CORYI|nr:hypothetical protein BT93_L3500 [Corymbia citriodora subsp. variegata]
MQSHETTNESSDDISKRSTEYHVFMLTVITALYGNSCVIKEKIKQDESMHFLPCLRKITFACSEAASKNSW